MAKKKSFFERLAMGKDNLPDYLPSQLPGSRWAVFKDVFFNRFGDMVKISLLTLLFMLPAIAWVIIVNMFKGADGLMIPYSSNIGIGYPVVTGAIKIGQYRAFMRDLTLYGVMIPLVMIASLGLAGAFYVLKNLAWGEGEGVAGQFFHGIKKCWKHFLWIGFFLGTSVCLMLLTISAFTNVSDLNPFIKWFGLIFSIFQAVMVLSMGIFLTTQEVTYNLALPHLFKNSFLFAITLVPFNLFFLILSALPIVLIMLFDTQIASLLIAIFAFIGPAYIMLIWTVYSQWVYDRYVNDRVKGAVKNRGMYVPTEQEDKQAEIERIKTRNVVYGAAYVSRRLSSIDAGATITPLESTFSRADLERLAKEKQVMVEETERERAEVDAQLEEEYRIYEESKKMSKRKRKKAQKQKKTADRAEQIATMEVTTEEYEDDGR